MASTLWHRGCAYGQDLRERVLAAAAHEPAAAVAERFAVSVSYVHKARARLVRLGQAAPGAQRNHVPAKLAGLEQALDARVASAPDATLRQLCEWVAGEHGVRVGTTTVHKTLARLGLRLKKSRSLPASSSAPT